MIKKTRSKTITRITNLLIFLAAILFLIGIFAPLMTLSKFYVFDNTVSIISSLQRLWLEGEYGLWLIIAGFSVLLPAIKILLLFIAFNRGRHGKAGKHLKRLSKYSKWSMLDVFVVALFFVAIKLGMIATIELHYGLYAFAASVLLTMFITSRVYRHVDR